MEATSSFWVLLSTATAVFALHQLDNRPYLPDFSRNCFILCVCFGVGNCLVRILQLSVELGWVKG